MQLDILWKLAMSRAGLRSEFELIKGSLYNPATVDAIDIWSSNVPYLTLTFIVVVHSKWLHYYISLIPISALRGFLLCSSPQLKYAVSSPNHPLSLVDNPMYSLEILKHVSLKYLCIYIYIIMFSKTVVSILFWNMFMSWPTTMYFVNLAWVAWGPTASFSRQFIATNQAASEVIPYVGSCHQWEPRTK